MPPTARTRCVLPLHRLLVAPVLAGALLLTGACSSDDDGGQGPGAAGASSSSSSASADVPSLIATGLQQIADQRYDDASATFDAVLVQDPHNVYATYNLGYVAQLRGDAGSAIQSYTATLAQDKDFSPALYNLAILTEASDLRGAVALYRREITVKPDDAAAHMRLGFALRHLGRADEAEQMLQKGIELDPAMADVPSPTYTS